MKPNLVCLQSGDEGLKPGLKPDLKPDLTLLLEVSCELGPFPPRGMVVSSLTAQRMARWPLTKRN